MFSSARRWLRRNRTPLALGLGVVGAGYVATQYVLGKLNDARDRMSSERIAKENLRRRFEQNQEDCTFTVLALLPTAMANILETMNTESITSEIQHTKGKGSGKAARTVGSLSPPSISDTVATDEDGRSMLSMQSESGLHTSQMTLPSPSADAPHEGPRPGDKPRKSKKQLWDELIISSITRAYTLIYVLGLLTMFTRVQLNLLGRRSYLSSVVSLATGTAQAAIGLENNDPDNDDSSDQRYGSDFQVNRRYLTFSWWLLNRGWIDMMHRVETAVRLSFGHLSPRDMLTLETFKSFTGQARKMIEGDAADRRSLANWLSFVLPPPDMEDFVLAESGVLDDSGSQPVPGQTAPPSPTASVKSLRRLLDETSDIVDSPAFSQVLTLLLDAGFGALLDKKLATEVFGPPVVPPPATTQTPEAQSAAAANTAMPGTRDSRDTRGTHDTQAGSRAVLLPKVLAVLTRQAHVIGNGMPNEYLHEMETVRDLEAFAAVVYSSNWEGEVRMRDSDEPGGGNLPADMAAPVVDPGKPATQPPGAGTGPEFEDVRPSQASGLSGFSRVSGLSGMSGLSTASGMDSGSVVVVDGKAFEGAWERAVTKSIPK